MKKWKITDLEPGIQYDSMDLVYLDQQVCGMTGVPHNHKQEDLKTGQETTEWTKVPKVCGFHPNPLDLLCLLYVTSDIVLIYIDVYPFLYHLL